VRIVRDAFGHKVAAPDFQDGPDKGLSCVIHGAF
jgi:hypothetical protein